MKVVITALASLLHLCCKARVEKDKNYLVEQLPDSEGFQRLLGPPINGGLTPGILYQHDKPLSNFGQVREKIRRKEALSPLDSRLFSES